MNKRNTGKSAKSSPKDATQLQLPLLDNIINENVRLRLENSDLLKEIARLERIIARQSLDARDAYKRMVEERTGTGAAATAQEPTQEPAQEPTLKSAMESGERKQ